MKLNIAQVIGLNTDQKAAQVISTSLDGGNFLAVLQLECDDAFTKGRQILSELSDYYFDVQSGTPSEKLTATFEEAQKKFAEESYSILLAAISGKVLYLIANGELEVYLKRGDKLSSLLSVGGSSQLISGFLQEGDRLLLSTKSLVEFLGGDLEKSLKLPLEAFEQELSDRIGASHVENQGLAALAVEVEGEAVLPEADMKYEEIPSIEEESSPLVSIPAVVRINPLAILKKFYTNYFPKSGRGRLILAVVLLVVVASGVLLKYQQTKNEQRKARFNQVLSSARDDFSAARGLASLNPAEAKSKLDSAKTKVNQALGLNSSDSEAQNLQKQIEQESPSILQEASVSDFPLFLDLDLIKKNFQATQLSLSAGKLLVLDPNVKTLVSIDLAKKSNQILAGESQLGEAQYASLNGGLAFVYSKDKGILRVDTQSQKVTTVAKNDEDWGKITDLYGFAGNVYVLDTEQIWKYLPTSGGYSDKREYLTKNTKAEFANSLKMQIESSIYILKSGGEILRFTKGDKDNFGLQGLPQPVKDPKSLFVSSDSENLYLLDSGNSRVLILTKTGSYKGQLTGSKFASASDLVVDEKGKKVYLLEGGKIYSVDLK